MKSCYISEYRNKPFIIDENTLRRRFVDKASLPDYTVLYDTMFRGTEDRKDLRLATFIRQRHDYACRLSIIYKELKCRVDIDYGGYRSITLCDTYVTKYIPNFATLSMEVGYVCKLGTGEYETLIGWCTRESRHNICFKLGAGYDTVMGVRYKYKESTNKWGNGGYFHPVTAKMALLGG